jgi:hypothetical protein
VRRAIAGVEVTEEFEGRGAERKSVGFTKKVRFWEKTKALELLGKHLGIFKDRVELSGPNGTPITLAKERTEEEMGKFAEMLAAADRRYMEGLTPEEAKAMREKLDAANAGRRAAGLPERWLPGAPEV